MQQAKKTNSNVDCPAVDQAYNDFAINSQLLLTLQSDDAYVSLRNQQKQTQAMFQVDIAALRADLNLLATLPDPTDAKALVNGKPSELVTQSRQLLDLIDKNMIEGARPFSDGSGNGQKVIDLSYKVLLKLSVFSDALTTTCPQIASTAQSTPGIGKVPTPVVQSTTADDGLPVINAFAEIANLSSYESEVREIFTPLVDSTKNQTISSKFRTAHKDTYEIIYEQTDLAGTKINGNLIRLPQNAYRLSQDTPGMWDEVGIDNIDLSGELSAPAVSWPTVMFMLVGGGGVDPSMAKVDFKQAGTGTEMVNGVVTKHYHGTLKDLKLDLLQFMDVGLNVTIQNPVLDFWVAEPGGYLVRSVFTGRGTDETGNQGKIDITFNLTNANKPVNVSPPPADKTKKLDE